MVLFGDFGPRTTTDRLFVLTQMLAPARCSDELRVGHVVALLARFRA